MDNISKITTKRDVKHIGMLYADLGKLKISALKYLVLKLNTLQNTFEFEFLPTPDDEFIQKLSTKATINSIEIAKAIQPFRKRYHKYLQGEIEGYNIKDSDIPIDHLIFVTMASFDNNYYSLNEDGLAILALANWKRSMYPPSIIEFILTLIMRESVAHVSPSLRDSMHLGTKGCLFDFTSYLSEVRIKVLSGFICDYCRRSLQSDGFETLADELVYVLKKEWLGKSTDPESPAGIAANLGYNLFITKGLKTTARENFLNTLQQEGIKQIIFSITVIIQSILLAIILILLGLKK